MDDLGVEINKEVLESIFALELRMGRIESGLAKLITRVDPTVSYAQVLEALRS